VQRVDDSLKSIEGNLKDQATVAQRAAQALDEQVHESQAIQAAMGATLAVTERNASATVQLVSSLEETTRTVEDLARSAQDLKQLVSRFQLA